MVQAYDFNGDVWTQVEGKERSEMCSDTLFVVTGTLFENDNTINANGREVGVPSHCYKLFLRTRLGKTGKHIMDITSADELKSIGFLYENSNSETRTPAETAVSVAEIEERAGFKFFQNLNPKIADKVKAQKNLKDWGL
jgi:endonuclease G